MPLIQDRYFPKTLFKNGHVNTMYPAFFRKANFSFGNRERFALSDGDFMDLDFKKQGSNKLAVLCHGLEGSSESSYILTAAEFLYSKGFDIMALNYRSCSGEMNNKVQMYHHGATQDVHEAIVNQTNYTDLHLIGWSLGGNLALKYSGEKREQVSNLKSVVGISVPVDLSSCVEEIHKPHNTLYVKNFVKTLKNKLKLKAEIMPDELNIEMLKEVKNLIHFDTHFTAPIHGFESGQDYYDKSSSLQFISDIKVPSLLINSLDDPMLGRDCYPVSLAENSSLFHFMQTKYGGHCGYVPPAGKKYWMENEIYNFITKHS